MKKLLIGLSLLALSATASADFFGGNNGEWKMGPYGPYYDESDWPEWTPMYWMEEFSNSWDNNDDNFGGMPMMGGYPGMMPYGGMPMGYGAPAMPYGGMPMGYGAPMMPMTQPQMAAPMPMPAPIPAAPAPVVPGATPGPAAN